MSLTSARHVINFLQQSPRNTCGTRKPYCRLQQLMNTSRIPALKTKRTYRPSKRINTGANAELVSHEQFTRKTEWSIVCWWQTDHSKRVTSKPSERHEREKEKAPIKIKTNCSSRNASCIASNLTLLLMFLWMWALSRSERYMKAELVVSVQDLLNCK